MTLVPTGRRLRPLDALFAGAVGVAVVGNVLGQIPFAASPFRPQLGYQVFDAAVGVVYAVCAALVWQLSPRRTPAVLMLAVSYSRAVGTLGVALLTEHWSWSLLFAGQGWVDALAPWIALAYPRGRLGDVWSRAVVTGLLLLYAGRSLLRAFFIDAGTWGWCDCLPNPLALPADPELVATLHDVTGQWMHAVLYAAALTLVLVRWARSSAPLRSVAFLMPLAFGLWTALSLGFDLQAFFGIEVWGINSQYLEQPIVSAVPLAYVAGLVHLRTMRGRVVDLVAAAGGGPDRAAWEQALSAAVGDPRMRLLWWDDGDRVHRDSAGRRVDPDRLDRDLARLLVGSPEQPVALVLHDPALAESRPLLESLAAALRLAADNERLTRDLQASLREAQESRARIVGAGDAARRRIERDLHDGSQQQLVSLAMSLRIAHAQASARGDAELAGQLSDAGDLLAEALASLRELARGIHPSVLTEGGLEAALRELAARSPLPVDVDVDVPEPLPEVVAATAYFTAAEALTNAAKHSLAAACSLRAAVDGDRLEVQVADEGAGGADPEGSGLRGLADRVEAVGGRLRVDSPPAGGTRLSVVLPLADRATGSLPESAAAGFPWAGS
ncbi:histidine kinase [Trujillonella humicola]|uniref:histidine kinase n=1 Tax=Trujillonella humicola TaxID=3383699 RepID=UPI003905B3A9